MEKIYSTAKICAFEDETRCDLSLDPGMIPVGITIPFETFFHLTLFITFLHQISALSWKAAAMRRNSAMCGHNGATSPAKIWNNITNVSSSWATKLLSLTVWHYKYLNWPSIQLKLRLTSIAGADRVWWYGSHVAARLRIRFLQERHRWFVVESAAILPGNPCLHPSQTASNLRGFSNWRRRFDPGSLAR